jgi:hypothetical protein
LVDIPDDDAPPPEWGQWEIWPVPALEPAAGLLVVRADGCVMPRRSSHGAEASSSRSALLAPNAVVACPEQERGHAGAPPAHYDEAQDEQALWQEFRDHGASLNNTLNEALRIHGGPAWRIFQVRISCWISSFFPCPFHIRAFLDFVFFRTLSASERS